MAVLLRSASKWLRTGDRWIPGLIVLAFLAMVAVNGRMVWLAIASDPGLVTDAAPVPDVAPFAVAIAFEGEAQRVSPVAVEVRDLAGRPVPANRITLTAERPTRYAQKITVPLEADGTTHRGRLMLPIGGEWVLTARAETQAGRIEARRTVEVAPGRVR
ncbi:MAG: FixH family protein [Sphingomonadaceae bacterium]